MSEKEKKIFEKALNYSRTAQGDAEEIYLHRQNRNWYIQGLLRSWFSILR